MFDPKTYRDLCDRLILDTEKIEEMIVMTENQNKKTTSHRPIRVALIAAALAAALGVTASAAELPAVKEFFATFFVTVTTSKDAAAGLNLPSVTMEERDGRSVLTINGEETDITEAMALDGGYHYQGDGFEVQVDERGVAVITAHGNDGTIVSYSTEALSEGGNTVYNVTTDGQPTYGDYNVVVGGEGMEAPVSGDEDTERITSYEIVAGKNGSVLVSPID